MGRHCCANDGARNVPRTYAARAVSRPAVRAPGLLQVSEHDLREKRDGRIFHLQRGIAMPQPWRCCMAATVTVYAGFSGLLGQSVQERFFSCMLFQPTFLKGARAHACSRECAVLKRKKKTYLCHSSFISGIWLVLSIVSRTLQSFFSVYVLPAAKVRFFIVWNMMEYDGI